MVKKEHQARRVKKLFHARPYDRFTEIKSNLMRNKLNRTNQGANFLRGSLRNRDNVRAPIHVSTTVIRLVR